jgi:hypothetical protein
MRRLVLPLLLLVAVFHATGALAAPVQQSAQFALQIRITGSGGTIAIAGSGGIDGPRKLSTFDFTANGKHFGAVIGASPGLTVFLKGETVQHLPHGATWAREDDATAGPLIDPGVALRIGSHLGPSLGTARLGGVTTTKHAIRIGLPDAALLAPMSPTWTLRDGIPVVVWVDGSGNVRRLQMVIARDTARFHIDEQLSAFGTKANIARPKANTVWDQRLDDALRLVRAAIPDVESYAADNNSVGKHDPNPRLSGYAGMTVTYLRHTYDSALGQVEIVRATARTYCVQATVNGISAKKNGPKAAVRAGRC